MTNFHRVLIATSDTLLGKALHDEFAGSVLAPSFRIALAEIRASALDCAIIDVEIEGGEGIALGSVLVERQPAARAALLIPHQRWASIDAAKKMGFFTSLNRNLPANQIKKLIEEATTQQSHLEATVLAKLSRREREILKNLAEGKRNREIAELHQVTDATVKSHLSSIYRKLGVRNRVEAVAQLLLQ